jgi:hypothetical protein
MPWPQRKARTADSLYCPPEFATLSRANVSATDTVCGLFGSSGLFGSFGLFGFSGWFRSEEQNKPNEPKQPAY